MIARREADAGQGEARTQGVPILDIWARLTTRPRAAQRRLPTWSLIPLGALSALALAFPHEASAHVVATPPFVAANGTATVSLSTPNERSAPMTGFRVTVPSGFVIEHAHPAAGWESGLEQSTATWTGGSLPGGGITEFAVQLKTPSEPAPVELTAELLYTGGDVVRWQVPLTVTPPEETPSENLALAAIVGLVGLVALAGVIALTWWRRRRSLQEK